MDVKLRTKAEIEAIVRDSPVVPSHKFLAKYAPERHTPEAAFGSTLDWLMRRGVKVREIPQTWDGTLTGRQLHNKIWSRYPKEHLAELARLLGIEETITGDLIYEYMKKYLAENPAGARGGEIVHAVGSHTFSTMPRYTVAGYSRRTNSARRCAHR